jgi:hypothetical protein
MRKIHQVSSTSNAIPDKASLLVSTTAVASFLTACLSWGLYFAVEPDKFQRLPSGEGAVLHTVLFVLAHVGLISCLPLLATGFSRIVEHTVHKTGDRDVEIGTSAYATKLLLCLSAAGFLFFSGTLVSLGVDGNDNDDDDDNDSGGHDDEEEEDDDGNVHYDTDNIDKPKPCGDNRSRSMSVASVAAVFRASRRRSRLLTPAQRGAARGCMGLALTLFAGLSFLPENALMPLEVWAFLVPAFFALSAFVETRKGDSVLGRFMKQPILELHSRAAEMPVEIAAAASDSVTAAATVGVPQPPG